MPWPNVAEIESVLPHDRWTLVGGLMVQLHAVRRGIDAVRATNDVDMAIHVETTRGVAAETASALSRLGYAFTPSIDARTRTAHRFARGGSVVDVLVADHAAPKVVEPLHGRAMVRLPGGTQALRRTLEAHLEIAGWGATTISVPSTFAALILKAAAYVADSRDRERHLVDAAVLLATLEDPYADREQFAGSDHRRLHSLARALPDNATAWRTLPEPWRGDAQAALRILTA